MKESRKGSFLWKQTEGVSVVDDPLGNTNGACSQGEPRFVGPRCGLPAGQASMESGDHFNAHDYEQESGGCSWYREASRLRSTRLGELQGYATDWTGHHSCLNWARAAGKGSLSSSENGQAWSAR